MTPAELLAEFGYHRSDTYKRRIDHHKAAFIQFAKGGLKRDAFQSSDYEHIYNYYFYWKTSKKGVKHVFQMSDTHIANCIEMQKRRSLAARKELLLFSFISGPQPSADAATDAHDQAMGELMETPPEDIPETALPVLKKDPMKTPIYAALCEELEWRLQLQEEILLSECLDPNA